MSQGRTSVSDIGAGVAGSGSRLEGRGLVKQFRAASGIRKRGEGKLAVADVSVAVAEGSFVGLVGESGSGKSTLARLLLGLLKPDQGQVMFNGRNVFAGKQTTSGGFRASVQAVLQDTGAALNPRKSVGRSIQEVLHLWEKRGSRGVCFSAPELLERVGLTPAESYLKRYPHELSGGQRQRVLIARALAPGPRLLIADEAVSALDVHIKVEILDLLEQLRRDSGLGILLVTHELSAIRAYAETIHVMYLGRIVESGSPSEIFGTPQSDHARQLVAAIPRMGEPIST